jgi:hypothetical protein
LENINHFPIEQKTAVNRRIQGLLRQKKERLFRNAANFWGRCEVRKENL